MRRLLSITLVALLGLPSVMALLPGSDESRLPACCRRNGAHHCAMSAAMMARMMEYVSREPGFAAPSHCPFYPTHGSPATAPQFAIAWTPESLAAPIKQFHAAIPFHASASSRELRAAANRGPPSHISA
jgi:hypothetical protein